MSTLSRDSLTGLTSSWIACWRLSKSPLAVSWNFSRVAFASSRNDWLLPLRASAARALKASANFCWAWFTTSSFSSACFRSWSMIVAYWASFGLRFDSAVWPSLTCAQAAGALAFQAGDGLVTGLNPLGQGNPFAFGIGLASVIGILALGPEDEPCGGHADGEADEEEKDWENLVHE